MKTYPVGLSGLESLVITKRIYYHSELLDSNRIRRIECNREDKLMIVKEKEVMTYLEKNGISPKSAKKVFKYWICFLFCSNGL